MNNGIYKNIIKKLHFEPTSACNARCPQCPRTFNTSLNTHPLLCIDEWKSNELKFVIEDPFFKDLETVLINGNYGDIVMHTDPKSIIEVFVNRGLFVDINTNGGAQSSEFWKWLGTQPNVLVQFGIDGLEDTHHLYRRNTVFSKIIQNAKTYINAGGTAKWIMTLFKHNAHQIEECRELAKTLGFNRFSTRESTRFSAEKLSISDKKFKHEYYLEPYTKENQNIIKEEEMYDETWYKIHGDIDILKSFKHFQTKYDDPVTCTVSQDASVFLSYDRRLWPCCHTAIGFEQSYKQNIMYDSIVNIFKEDIENDANFNNVLNHSIDTILNHNMLFRKIEKTWNTPDVCTSCIMNCKDGSHLYRQYQTDTLVKMSEN